MSEHEQIWLATQWWWWARPSQRPPPGDWRVWLILAGRGFGKTRTGAEWSRAQAEADEPTRGALVGRTAADVRDVMIEGESGILACCPHDNMPEYEPSKRRLTWPNGSTATAYTADEPNLLRGPQHHWAWVDELAAHRYRDTWDQLMFGLRLGDDPRCVATTTPRPVRVIRDLIASKTTHVTRGSTFENRDNLAQAFFTDIISKYEGTTIGRQELYAEVLDEMPGALWTRGEIDAHRVDNAPPMRRVVVSIDPAVSSSDDSDETGITAEGMGEDGQGYLLADRTGRMSPDEWARAAVDLHHEIKADRIVAEVNNGGDLVERVIRTIDENVPYTAVHASKGKRARAEPIAAMYEQGKMHHVGIYPDLEDQLCTYTAEKNQKSPDRLDSLVWGFTELFECSAPMVDLDASALNQESGWAI